MWKEKSIILSLLETVDVSNILLRKFVFYQLKQCHIQQGMDQEFKKFHYRSLLHRSQLCTATEICSQFHRLLIYLYVWKTVAT
jgi:hypothetical protein